MDKKTLLEQKSTTLRQWKHENLHFGFLDSILNEVYDLAHQAGRESLLKAAEELVHGSSTLDSSRAIEANNSKQSADILRILGDWIELSPNSNCYSVGSNSDRIPAKKYSVYLHRYAGSGNKMFYGSSQMGALADAAQSILAEVEEARANK